MAKSKRKAKKKAKKRKKKTFTAKAKRIAKTKSGRTGIGAGAGALLLGPIGAVGGALYGMSTAKKNPGGRIGPGEKEMLKIFEGEMRSILRDPPRHSAVHGRRQSGAEIVEGLKERIKSESELFRFGEKVGWDRERVIEHALSRPSGRMGRGALEEAYDTGAMRGFTEVYDRVGREEGVVPNPGRRRTYMTIEDVFDDDGELAYEEGQTKAGDMGRRMEVGLELDYASDDPMQAMLPTAIAYFYDGLKSSKRIGWNSPTLKRKAIVAALHDGGFEIGDRLILADLTKNFDAKLRVLKHQGSGGTAGDIESVEGYLTHFSKYHGDMVKSREFKRIVKGVERRFGDPESRGNPKAKAAKKKVAKKRNPSPRGSHSEIRYLNLRTRLTLPGLTPKQRDEISALAKRLEGLNLQAPEMMFWSPHEDQASFKGLLKSSPDSYEGYPLAEQLSESRDMALSAYENEHVDGYALYAEEVAKTMRRLGYRVPRRNPKKKPAKKRAAKKKKAPAIKWKKIDSDEYRATVRIRGKRVLYVLEKDAPSVWTATGYDPSIDIIPVMLPQTLRSAKKAVTEDVAERRTPEFNVSAFEPGPGVPVAIGREEEESGRMRRSPSPGHHLARVPMRPREVAMADTKPVDNPTVGQRGRMIAKVLHGRQGAMSTNKIGRETGLSDTEVASGLDWLRHHGWVQRSGEGYKLMVNPSIEKDMGTLRRRKVRSSAVAGAKHERSAKGLRSAKVRRILAANPLAPGPDSSVIHGNIRELIHAGVPQQQACAAAYEHARATSPAGTVAPAPNPLDLSTLRRLKTFQLKKLGQYTVVDLGKRPNWKSPSIFIDDRQRIYVMLAAEPDEATWAHPSLGLVELVAIEGTGQIRWTVTPDNKFGEGLNAAEHFKLVPTGLRATAEIPRLSDWQRLLERRRTEHEKLMAREQKKRGERISRATRGKKNPANGRSGLIVADGQNSKFGDAAMAAELERRNYSVPFGWKVTELGIHYPEGRGRGKPECPTASFMKGKVEVHTLDGTQESCGRYQTDTFDWYLGDEEAEGISSTLSEAISAATKRYRNPKKKAKKAKKIKPQKVTWTKRTDSDDGKSFHVSSIIIRRKPYRWMVTQAGRDKNWSLILFNVKTGQALDVVGKYKTPAVAKTKTLPLRVMNPELTSAEMQARIDRGDDPGARARARRSQEKKGRLTEIPEGVEIQRVPPGRAEGAELPGEWVPAKYTQRAIPKGIGVRANNPKENARPIRGTGLAKHYEAGTPMAQSIDPHGSYSEGYVVRPDEIARGSVGKSGPGFTRIGVLAVRVGRRWANVHPLRDAGLKDFSPEVYGVRWWMRPSEVQELKDADNFKSIKGNPKKNSGIKPRKRKGYTIQVADLGGEFGFEASHPEHGSFQNFGYPSASSAFGAANRDIDKRVGLRLTRAFFDNPKKAKRNPSQWKIHHKGWMTRLYLRRAVREEAVPEGAFLRALEDLQAEGLVKIISISEPYQDPEAGPEEGEILLRDVKATLTPAGKAFMGQSGMMEGEGKKHARLERVMQGKPVKTPSRNSKKTAKRKTTPEWQRLTKRCQKLWESYCERPGKKRLRLVLAHLEKMKSSTSAKVKAERSRCLRTAKAEAKKLKMKL